jgi:predicted nuclease of predicted toxin-antitoxin system
MKLLIDSNLSWRLVKLLENDFPECLHVNRSGLIQPPSDRQFLIGQNKMNAQLFRVTMIFIICHCNWVFRQKYSD